MKKVNEWIGAVRTFLDEVRAELRKCSWPTRQELLQSTLVVVVSVVLLALYIGVCDKVLVTIVRMMFQAAGG